MSAKRAFEQFPRESTTIGECDAARPSSGEADSPTIQRTLDHFDSSLRSLLEVVAVSVCDRLTTGNPTSGRAVEDLQVVPLAFPTRDRADEPGVRADVAPPRSRHWATFRERFAAQLRQMCSSHRIASFRERLDGLSAREWEALLHILQGTTCKESAPLLGVATSTAARVRARVFDKLGTRNPVELAQLVSELSEPGRIVAARLVSE